MLANSRVSKRTCAPPIVLVRIARGQTDLFQFGYELRKLDVAGTSRVHFVLKKDVQNGVQSRMTLIIFPLAIRARRSIEDAHRTSRFKPLP